MRWIEARCRRARARRLAADHVRDRRPARAAGGGPAAPRRLHGLPPVRVGNAASDHLQLDIYGELMDSVYLYDKYGAPIGYDAWVNIVRLLDWVCAQLAAAGRGHLGGARWTAGVPLLAGDVLGGRRPRHPARQKRSFPAPLDALVRRRATTIYQDVFSRFWDPTRRAFIQHVGAHHARRLGAADAARPLRLPHRSALDIDAARDRAGAGERLAGLSLSPAARILRRARPGKRDLHACAPSGTSSACPACGDLQQGTTRLREDARLRQPPRACTARSWGPRRNISATSLRRSRTWPSSAPPSISTADSRPPATPGDRDTPRVVRTGMCQAR